MQRVKIITKNKDQFLFNSQLHKNKYKTNLKIYTYLQQTWQYTKWVFITQELRTTIIYQQNNLKENKIGHLKIKNYKFERVENFKYLGIILNEDNNNQIDLQERIKNANKTYFMLQEF